MVDFFFIHSEKLNSKDNEKMLLFECRALQDFHVYFKNMSGIENALLLTIDLYYGFTFLYSSSIFVLTLTSVDLKSYMFFFWTHSPNKNQIITNNLPYPTIGLGPP